MIKGVDMKAPLLLHELSDIQSKTIGEGTKIWQFCVVMPGAKLGMDCNICSHCFIENDVVIGDRVTVKSGVQLWDGLRIEDNVFIGPNVTFTNDKYPRSKQYLDEFAPIVIKKNASIGDGFFCRTTKKFNTCFKCNITSIYQFISICTMGSQ